jgi:hypothetical protein
MGIQDEVRKLVNSESARHKRLIEYTVRQLKTGRDLADVMEDPFITNRLSVVERRALLDEPDVIAAASEDVLERMRAQLEAVHRG